MSFAPGTRLGGYEAVALVASLNHPHICTLYDVSRPDGTDFLVVDCLEERRSIKRSRRFVLYQCRT
jgi:hypothetical protein